RVAAPNAQGNVCIYRIGQQTVAADGMAKFDGLFAVGRVDDWIEVSICQADASFADPARQVDGELMTPPTLISHSLQCRPAKSDDHAVGRQSQSPEEQLSSIADQLVVYRHETTTILTNGDTESLAAMEQMVNEGERNRRLAAVFRTSQESLPSDRSAYDGIDTLVMTERFDLSDQQFQALQDWVLNGGHLIVCSGSTIQELLETRLGQWLQPVFSIRPEPTPIRDLTTLQDYVPGATRIEMNREAVPIAVALHQDPLRIVQAFNYMLIGRQGIGAGIVTFVGIELTQQPLRSWKSLPRLYDVLIFGERYTQFDKAAQGTGSRISSSGVNDLATQWIAASDAVPQSDRHNSWQVMLLMVIYLGIVGPLDYLIVTYWLRRPHLTWLTLPIIVAVGCAVIVLMPDSGSAEFRGTAINVVDVTETAEGQNLCLRSYSSLSSRQTRRADLRFELKSPVANGETVTPRVNWLARSEDVYGGMYRLGGTRLSQESFLHRQVESDALHQFQATPMLSQGSQAFYAEWFARNVGEPLVESQLHVTSNGLLEGTLTSRLSVPLRDWFMVHASRAYLPRRRRSSEGAAKQASQKDLALDPGETWSRRDSPVRVLDLSSFLSSTRLSREQAEQNEGTESGSASLPDYDMMNMDAEDILMMISLYQAAGAREYTHVGNDQFRRMELSDSIRLNQVLLIGLADLPVTSISVDGKPVDTFAQSTVVRLILPATPSDSDDARAALPSEQ
ncbi:MAG: hypothetical protein KDA96_20065, partial [Planctomycetaceae bacterium]|nr:hypothetical protein [Planctomycetaceae bacterium]